MAHRLLHESDPEIDVEPDVDEDDGTAVDPVFKPRPDDAD